MTQCPICKREFRQITNSHLMGHGLSLDQFKSLLKILSYLLDGWDVRLAS